MEFRRASPFVPAYDFREFTSGGSNAGEGKALLKGNILHIKGHSASIGEYSGELQVKGGEMKGPIRDASGNEVPVTLTGTPSTSPTPPHSSTAPPALTPPTATDLSGEWVNPHGGSVEFRRASALAPVYDFMAFTSGGSNSGPGKASVKGGILLVEGNNDFVGDYTGELQISDNQLTGVIKFAPGHETPVLLVRGKSPTLFRP